MQKLIKPVIALLIMSGSLISAYSQSAGIVKHGPSGIFIFMGKEIPSGINVSSYKIERSQDSINWEPLAELKIPSSFDAFKKAIDKAKLYFPVQPIPSDDKLTQLYQKAVATGNTDSLKGMRLLFPIRVALGIMYYDTTASKHTTYRYRVNADYPKSKVVQSFVSDTVSFAYSGQFDSISYSESSQTPNSLVVKWKSAGKNSAPLFAVYTFRYGASVPARGITSRYSVNDTTYYVFTDTTIVRQDGKELQFFISPYDQFGNSGKSSQVAIIDYDNFNRATFVRNHIEFMPKLSGVQINWHHTDPVTVKKVEIFRSENEKSGYQKLAETEPGDTTYLDQQIWPEKQYYYYIQAVAKAGNRAKLSEILKAWVPPVSVGTKLNAPVFRHVAVANNSIRLLIEVNDTTSTHLRIYRGVKGGLVALPELVKIDRAGIIAFTDQSMVAAENKDMLYAVRNEKDGKAISSLSEQLPVAVNTDVNEVAYFYAFPSNDKIELYWDDVINRKSEFKSCTLARQYGPANSKSPLIILAENLTGSSYVDTTAQTGNTYTYILSLIDKAGNSSGKTYTVTYSPGK